MATRTQNSNQTLVFSTEVNNRCKIALLSAYNVKFKSIYTYYKLTIYDRVDTRHPIDRS